MALSFTVVERGLTPLFAFGMSLILLIFADCVNETLFLIEKDRLLLPAVAAMAFVTELLRTVETITRRIIFGS